MRGEFCVNVSRFSAPLVGSYGEFCVAEKTKSQRDEGTKSQRVKETKGQRVKETKGREDENRVTSYSPPIHLLFVSSSPPLHRPIRSNLIQFVSKNICEIRVQNSFTPENTAL